MVMRKLWQALRRLGAAAPGAAAIDDALWQRAIAPMAFLTALPPADQARLRRLAQGFLRHKEFHGLAGLEVTDDMAVQIAAQACRPLLHLGPPDAPEQALRWYDGFVGVIVSPREVKVRRDWTDDSGVVHQGWEVVSGETGEQGPVLLSWPDVQTGMQGRMRTSHAQSGAMDDPEAEDALHGVDACSDVAGDPAEHPYNVVIHEFCHKLDMRTGEADGCPPLPSGFLGHKDARRAREAWFTRLNAAFETHIEQVAAAERFGQPAPWLDPYGADSLVEFFPVACEGYFTALERFRAELPELAELFDAFFMRGA